MARSAKQTKLSVLPPGASAAAERGVQSNLPAYLTPLLGRQQEVQAACSLLQRSDVRLLTLTGTGGVGKTRLGVQIATELLDDFADGVSFVSLAPISDPDFVIATIAKTLDLKEAGDLTLMERLKAYLRDRYLLLVLDNFEHVVAAAPLFVELLATCPKVKALVTSRTVLRVNGEYECRVPPLSLPDLDHLPERETLAQYAAVELFLQRAVAVHPGFQLTRTTAGTVAEICTRLDGLPLAIELAAARIKILSPRALLARLEHRLQVLTGGARDAPARQQTLRNTLAWSYDLLSAQEQRLFRRLSVFVGGCTLEAVEAISSAFSEVSADILDGVASLLDKSLVQRLEQQGGEPRFLMLETIREYGLERLEALGEMEATRSAHASHYLAMLEEAWPHVFEAEQGQWFDLLERELNNLRAMLQWSLERAKGEGAERVLRMSILLLQFGTVRGHVSEWRRWLERALAVSEAGVTIGRARALYAAGTLTFLMSEYDAAEALCKEGLTVYQAIGDTSGVGLALLRLGLIALERRDYAMARSLTEDALVLFREANDDWTTFGIAFALDSLVRMSTEQGEYARARSLVEESLVLSRERGDRWNTAKSLFHLTLLCFCQRDLMAARSEGEESLAFSRELGYKWGLAFSLSLSGLLALQQGDEATAHSLLEEAFMIRRGVGDPWSIRWGFYCLGWVALDQWDRAVAGAMYEKLLVVLRQLDDKEFTASCLQGLGRVVAAQGDPSAAVRLWGAAASLHESSDFPLPPINHAAYERSIASLRRQLGEEVFAAAWAEGRTMTPEQALATLQRPMKTQRAPSGMSLVTHPDGLTEREGEVLRLLATGLTIAQIAEQLIISYHTAHTHVRSIYNKLGITSRSAATRYAIERHLI